MAKLPLPLARLYRRTFNDKALGGQHNNAFFLVEATIKLAVAAELAIYLRGGKRDEQLEASTLRHLSLPSFGHWVSFLREVSKRNAKLRDHPFEPLSGVAAWLDKRRELPAAREFLAAAREYVDGLPRIDGDRVRVLDLVDQLPAYRNQIIGHGAQQTESFYRRMAPALLDAAAELLESAPIVTSCRLVCVSEITETADHGKQANLWEYTGSDAVRLKPQVASSEIKVGHLYLEARGALLDLHPFLVSKPAPPDPVEVMFLNRSRLGKRAEYLNYVTGAAFSAPNLIEDHRRILGRLIGSGDMSASDYERLQSESHEQPHEREPVTEPEGRRFGDFLLLSQLGAGSMGTVYLARQLSLDRLVALKMLPPKLADDEVAERRFQREVKALARADHPNVVRILQSGLTDGIYWFAMEYVEGSTLAELSDQLADTESRSSLTSDDLAAAVSDVADRRRRELEIFAEVPVAKPADREELGTGKPFLRRIADIFADAAHGIEHLHHRRVTHRDIKPDNIMVTRSDGRAVVMDLGLAHIVGDASMTPENKAVGAVRYIAPEALMRPITKQRVDQRADIYSLGASLYALSTGHPPYEDEAPEIARATGKPPKVPRTIDPHVPADLDAIIQKAMALEPQRRYGTAADMAEDLHRFSRNETVVARPPTVFYRALSWARRNRALSGTIAAAAVILVSVSAVLLSGLSKAERKGDRHEKEALEFRISKAYAPSTLSLDPDVTEGRDALDRWIDDLSDLDTAIRALFGMSLAAKRASIERREAERGGKAATYVDNLEQIHDFEIIDRAKRLRADLANATATKHASKWQEALASIRRSKKYAPEFSASLQPQNGLVPIGQDKDSDLWEFAHPQSGTIPQRVDGKLEQPRPEHGLVFVLIPGGTARIGAKPVATPGYFTDPFAQDYESGLQPQTVELAPFFLAKYEMTQAQWRRLTGRNPSKYHPFETDGDNPNQDKRSLAHPVEMVQWLEATALLRRLGLDLPTEVQWEYAARAGTAWPWWTGADAESLEGAANVADKYCKENHGSEKWKYVSWSDGWTAPAPVGSFRANAFGLHDVLGNVEEFCRDIYLTYDHELEPGTGLRKLHENEDSDDRVARGGCWSAHAVKCRCSFRQEYQPDRASTRLGLRPMRAVK